MKRVCAKEEVRMGCRLCEVHCAVQCQRCLEPVCVYAWLTGAMQQDALTGNVSREPDRLHD